MRLLSSCGSINDVSWAPGVAVPRVAATGDVDALTFGGVPAGKSGN